LSLLINPRSPAAEAFRTLRTSLHYVADREKCRVVLVTSVSPYDGKTLVTTNLGVSLAQAGEKVLVVDGDMRKPRCHRVFALRNRTGLTNVLVDSVDLSAALQESSVPGLHVLTSGPIPPNPAELLESRAMDDVLQTARDQYDHVLVDSPPAGPLADASILASKVDGIILVLTAGETRVDHARDVRESLERARGKVLGVVLNRVRYSTNDYRYRYYYHEDAERGEPPAEDTPR
jgi:capsular exopolysaccharide synthesis family protein